MNFISHNYERSQCKGKFEILGWQSRQVWRDGKCLLINEFFKLAFLLQIWWFFFFFPGQTACGIIKVPQPGIKPTALIVKVQSLNHWMARKSC